MQPNFFDFGASLTQDQREAAIDLVTADDNRALLNYALEVLCLSKRQLVHSINANGDFAALGQQTALVAEFAEMLEKLAFLVKHAANTINLVMSEPGSAIGISKGSGNAAA